jgi:tetratricopeptide (TPR) repeat protein
MGMWDDVIISVTADHGESLGEHGEKTHGFFLYDATLRIPWILKMPGMRARHVPELVRIVDEMPTILDLAGAGDPEGGRSPIDGVSLAAALASGSTIGRAAGVAYSETFLPRDQFGWSPLTAIRSDRFKYIGGPDPELYDLTADPHEAANVLASLPEEEERLKRVLGTIARTPAPSQARRVSDPAMSEKLMSLGYVAYSPSAANTGTATLQDPKSKIGVYTLTMAALEFSENGDLQSALRAIDEAERLDPNVAQVEFVKGTLLGNSDRYEEAVKALERTLELNPDYTAARFKLALAWLRIGHSGRAAEALQAVVRQQPDDFRAWHNLAAVAYSRGDLDQAETLERKAVALSPGYAEAWNTLGAIALIRRQTAPAVDALTRATELGPQNAQAFQNLSLALRAAGEQERARAAAARACAIDKRFCSTTGGER